MFWTFLMFLGLALKILSQDLILETKIMIPTNMSNQEESLFKELKEKSNFNPRSEF